jgi:hypothetical protein
MTVTKVLNNSGFIPPCIPTRAASRAGLGANRHDRYRRIVRSDDDTVRLFTRRGSPKTKRRIAVNVARLPELMGKRDRRHLTVVETCRSDRLHLKGFWLASGQCTGHNFAWNGGAARIVRARARNSAR